MQKIKIMETTKFKNLTFWMSIITIIVMWLNICTVIDIPRYVIGIMCSVIVGSSLLSRYKDEVYPPSIFSICLWSFSAIIWFL